MSRRHLFDESIFHDALKQNTIYLFYTTVLLDVNTYQAMYA